MLPVLLGIVVGLPCASAVTQALKVALIGVTAHNPLTFAAAVLVLALAGLAGCAIPARRAVAIDPALALRYE